MRDEAIPDAASTRRLGGPPAAGAFVGLAVAVVAVTLAALLVGAEPVSLAGGFEAGSRDAVILWRLRLPRVLLGLLAGGGLAISGLAFQTVFRNPLAEPYTLGVAGGAALGASFVIVLGGSGAALPWISLAAFAGALAVGGVIVGLAASRRGIASETLLLAGIALSITCSALILLLQSQGSMDERGHIVQWMMGSLSVVGYREVGWLALWTAVGAAVLLGHRWELDVLLTGEEVAVARGVDLKRVRVGVLAAVSAMVGALVAVTGPIGFVGLVVPHLLRRLVGPGHLRLAPACLLGGGAFLVFCDLVARALPRGMDLPVGVVTALVGGVFFLWLLVGRRPTVSS